MPHHMQPQFIQQQQQMPQQHQMHHPGPQGGGPPPEHFDDFRRPGLRGGWGHFIGLKGGRPIENNSIRNPIPHRVGGGMGTPGNPLQMAVVTSASPITSLPQQQQQQPPQPQQQQHAIVSTATNNTAVSTNAVASSLTSGGFTQVRPLQVTTAAIRGPQGIVTVRGPRPTATIPVRPPNLQQMPPSSAHQVFLKSSKLTKMSTILYLFH